MTPSRPYLVRAIYDWIVDNSLTPYMLVDAEHEGVVVPTEYIDGGKIVLNIAPRAVNALGLGNEEVTFSARFSGVAMDVQVPITAVLALYARENGQGMLFGESEPDGDGGPDDGGDDGQPKRPQLRVVK